MPAVRIERSTQFVSLDTHPANDALVVTYEICARAFEPETQRELARRNKRSQFQLKLPALNETLNQGDQKEPANRRLDVRQLCNQILAKCKLLATAKRDIREEIELHLLYLVARRQQQLSSAHGAAQRPSSAALAMRLSSATSSRPSRRHRSASKSGQRSQREPETSDLYGAFLSMERDSRIRTLDEQRQQFLSSFIVRLEDLEESLGERLVKLAEHRSADQLLEGLYGELAEQLSSVLALRRLAQDGQLRSMAANELLLRAMLRILAEDQASGSDQSTHLLVESILYCLIRLTSFQELRKLALDELELVNLVDRSLGMLSNKWDGQHYRVNALLLLLANLFAMDPTIASRQAAGTKLVVNLFASLNHASSQLQRDTKLLRSTELSLDTAANSVHILWHLSVYRELVVGHFRGQQLAGLVSLLNFMQIARQPDQRHQETPIELPSDKPANLVASYSLELALLRLVSNLIFDQRLRPRLMKRGVLLKCVLRNLVAFLANGTRSYGLYRRSSVLLAPLRCLHELSCEPSVRDELSRSKLIIKCLLEFLLSAQRELDASVGLLATSEDQTLADQTMSRQQVGVVLIEDFGLADNYLLSVWANLSSQPSGELLAAGCIEIGDQLRAYCQRTIKTLARFSAAGYCDPVHTLIYVHLKLLRNLSKFTRPANQSELTSWLDTLADGCRQLLDSLPSSIEPSANIPLAVDGLATLSNLLLACQPGAALGDSLASLMVCVSRLPASVFAGADNDDLLMASCLALGNLAERRPLCSSVRKLDSFAGQILEACLTIWGSRDACADPEPIICSLFALDRLMGHAGFLRQLVELMAPTEELEEAEDVQSSESWLLSRMVDQLASLSLEPNQLVARLALRCLDLLRLLEQQLSMSSWLYRRRFVAYHRKWWASIGSCTDDEEEDSDSDNRQDDRGSYADTLSEGSDAELRMMGNLEELNNLRSVESRSLTGSQADRMSVRSGQQGAGAREPQDSDPLSDYEDEYQDQEEDLFGPDANVIDANSMIKHLVARRP